MQQQEHFERYTPQFPLPVDISTMSRQDTVCQFCGISYLIHNEIKALESKCQQLEADLAYYAGMNSREAALEQSLQTERTRIVDLESTVAINTHKLNEMTRRSQLMHDRWEQSDNAYRETKASLSQCSSNLRATYNRMQTLRKEHVLLKEIHSKETQNYKIHMKNVETILMKEIQTYSNKTIKQMDDYRNEIEHYQQELNESNRLLRDLQQSHIDSNRLQNDFERESRIQHDELTRLRQQLSQLQQTHTQTLNDCEQTKQQCRQFERDIAEKDQSKKNGEILLEQFRQQLTNEKELRTKTDAELAIVRSKLVQLTGECEQLNLTNRTFEMNEMNIKRKMDETNRTRQAVLDRTRDEYEKLLRKYNELDEIYRELVDVQEKKNSESQTIRTELERLHNENIELTKQRETIAIAHDVQMKKVHDSYAMKLREAEQWPDRLQTELNREREQYRIQLNELERRLKQGFVTELDIEKQKYTGLVRKYEQDSGQSTQQLRHELISTEKVTMEQRQYYERQIEQLEHDKNELRKELDTLRDVLKELHEQMNGQESASKDRMNNLQLKEDLLAKETSLFQAQSTVDQLEKDLEQAREEMSTLQETVHKECTEREELKEALIEARQQLLAMKKNGVLNGMASRSLHSPPVAYKEIERRVTGPLPYSQPGPSIQNKNPSFVRSEPVRDGHSPTETAADSMARPMSSHGVQYRHKTLPPIHQQQRNGGNSSSNKAEQLLENQRRIARFIRHIK